MNEVTMWNGYPVHGDVKELDRIAEATGFINLDKTDIISTLSADDENFVVTSKGQTIGEAFNNAVKNLPCRMDKLKRLLIEFRAGDKTNAVVENFSKINETFPLENKDLSVKWGITRDDSLDNSFLVVLVASAEK